MYNEKMVTAYSITFTPSHECVTWFADFIVRMEHKPVPARAELLQLMQELNALDIRTCQVRVKGGEWSIEFTVNENRKYKGTDKRFDVALEQALNAVRRQRLN